jgi:hypothetical protein
VPVESGHYFFAPVKNIWPWQTRNNEAADKATRVIAMYQVTLPNDPKNRERERTLLKRNAKNGETKMKAKAMGVTAAIVK